MTQQIFTRCKCGGELVAFGTRCLQCGPVFPIRVGVDFAGGSDATVIARAADFHDRPNESDVLTLDVLNRAKKLMDEKCDVTPLRFSSYAAIRDALGGTQWTPKQRVELEQAKTARDSIDKVCGLQPLGRGEKFVDLRSEHMRAMVASINRELPPQFLNVARDAGRSGLSRELRERAELAAGRVTAVNFTRAAPDEAIVTHLCEIVERLCGTDVAQLDQENARLRRELAEAKASRDGWQDQARTLMSLTAGLRKRLGEREDNVTYVEPFPDVRPYAGDWIPPSHKPRMLP